jgi:hypothetical protein
MPGQPATLPSRVLAATLGAAVGEVQGQCDDAGRLPPGAELLEPAGVVAPSIDDDVEDLLAERGLDISYETIRSWVLKFRPVIARRLRRRRPRPSDRWHLDGVSRTRL